MTAPEPTVGRVPAELRLLRVVEADARAEALVIVERAWVALTTGYPRLDVIAADLRHAADRLTTRVDRRLTTAIAVLDRDWSAVPLLICQQPGEPRPAHSLERTS